MVLIGLVGSQVCVETQNKEWFGLFVSRMSTRVQELLHKVHQGESL